MVQVILLEIRRHDINHVIIQDSNDLRQALLFLAVIDEGRVPVIIPKSWTEKDIRKFLSDQPRRWIFLQNGNLITTKEDGSSELGQLPTYGVFSSGSSACPRLYYFSVEQARLNARAHASSQKLSAATTIVKVLNTDHAFGICAYIWTPLELDCEVVFSDIVDEFVNYREFSLDSILYLTPRQTESLILKRPSILSRFHKISIGSDWLASEHLKYLSQQTGAEIYITYGLTEAGPRVSTYRYYPQSNSDNYPLGFPLDFVRCKVLNSTGKITDYGEGLLLIKSPYLATDLSPDQQVGQYLKTRDKVKINTDGFIELILNENAHFKFNGHLIDLNELKRKYCPESSMLYAVTWSKDLRKFWALIIYSPLESFITPEFDFNVASRPEKIVQLKELNEGLNKLTVKTVKNMFNTDADDFQMYRSSM